MKRILILLLAKADEALDELLYRPAVVKAFMWLPRWWLCDLARLSVRLDRRWGVGYWTWLMPGEPCEACGRRASIHVHGGPLEDEGDEDEDVDGADQIGAGGYRRSVLDDRAVNVCGWCHLSGPIFTEQDLTRELLAARADSVAWRWRWRVRP